MNGKAAKLLRRMHRANKPSKRAFNALTHIEKGKLRKKFNETPITIDVDYSSWF